MLVFLEGKGNIGSDFPSEIEKYGSDIIMNHSDFWQYSSKLSDEYLQLLKKSLMLILMARIWKVYKRYLMRQKQYSFLENSDVANMKTFLNLRGQLNSGKLGIEEFIKCVDSLFIITSIFILSINGF